MLSSFFRAVLTQQRIGGLSDTQPHGRFFRRAFAGQFLGPEGGLSRSVAAVPFDELFRGEKGLFVRHGASLRGIANLRD